MQNDPKLELHTEIKSFGDLLGGIAHYRIPFLQRPFQWGVLQVGDMVGDLIAAYQAGYNYYFLGHLIAVVGDDGVTEIVDGQQRLTTFTILLAYLRDALAASDENLASALRRHIMVGNRPRLMLREADAAFLHAHVQTPGGITVLTEDYHNKPAPFVPGTDAQAHIVNAAKQIRSQLERLGAEPLAGFAHFLLERAIVGFMVARDRSGAAMIIRGMNMRGQQMTPADLIKVEAIGASGLDQEQQVRAARAWEQVEDRLGAEDFAFLLALLPQIVSRQATKRPGDLAEWRKNAFSHLDPSVLLSELLPQYADLFVELSSGEVEPELTSKQALAAMADVNRRLRGLLFLQERHWMGPAITALAANRARPEFLSRFFQGLERLSFACFLDAVRHEDRPERFAAIIRAGADEERLALAFALTQDQIAKMWRRLREPFARHNWRRRAVAFRANAALAGGLAFKPNDDVTVEHVLPSSFNKEWEALGWTQRNAVLCSDLLGNFTVLSGALNRAASCRPFREKKEIYFSQEPIHALTGELKDYQDWTEQTIRTRTDALAKALLADWGL